MYPSPPFHHFGAIWSAGGDPKLPSPLPLCSPCPPELVAHEFTALLGEDRLATGETCPVLLALAGRGVSESEAVREHAEDECSAAAAGRLATQERLRIKPSRSRTGISVSSEADFRQQTDQEGQRNDLNWILAVTSSRLPEKF